MDIDRINELDKIYVEIAKQLDISDTLFERAETSYKALGSYLSNNIEDYGVNIYPQGSFALGTVIKPVSDEEEYDLDLVCELEKALDISAKKLKVDLVGELVKNYKRLDKEPIEKKRCWQLVYADSSQFHMDIIPAVYPLSGNTSKLLGKYIPEISRPSYSKSIAITDKNEEKETYSFKGSNPKGYIAWFTMRQEVIYNKTVRKIFNENRAIFESMDEVPKYKVKTPLQQAIQILKRHRDNLFDGKQNESDKPISIIITTLAAHAYDNQESLYDTLMGILNGMQNFIQTINGEYHIDNPSYPDENFADKWNSNAKRRNAFYDWLKSAKEDIINNHSILTGNRIDIATHLKKSLGDNVVARAFSSFGEKRVSALNNNQYPKIDTQKGVISPYGDLQSKPNKHYGQVSME